MNGTFIFLTKTLKLCEFPGQEKKEGKKTRKCVCNCEQHMFIDSMGQGLSAATHQFSNCLILLTCVNVCVYVGECASVLTLVFP